MKFRSAALFLSLNQLAGATPFRSKVAFFNHINQIPRGGDETAAATEVTSSQDEDNLEDRVHAAMAKLGLSSPEEIAEKAQGGPANAVCKDGVCEIKPSVPSPDNTESFEDMKKRLSEEMNVDETIVQAALGATLQVGTEPEEQRLNEEAARTMIQYEIDAIQKVMEDSDEVKQLVDEGHDPTLSRRALAFADMNVEVARAILIADEEDEIQEQEQLAKIQAEREEEEKRAKLRAEAEQRKKEEAQMKTINVDPSFDPTNPMGQAAAKPAAAPAAQTPPKPAKKEDVVFQATAENIQKLVLESPVPVLLDVYADWCGPCKALTPALEQMAVKAGGMFRLVKLNTDEERNISSALEVTSLPTIFGMKDGQIIHSFKGMPRDEEFMKSFMMGLFTGTGFSPAPTNEEKEKYTELTNKLIKIAGASGFTFSQRERLQVRTNSKLDELVEVRGDMADAEESAKVVRSLLSNIIRDPFDTKFRKVNLDNKIIAARVGAFAPAVSILKAVGFKEEEDSVSNSLVLGKGKKIVNVAPLVVARDTIDKWIDLNRRAIATASRKKQDEEARQKLLDEAEEIDDDEESEDETPQIDPNACNLKLRIEGKKKMHDLSLSADDTLESIIKNLPASVNDGEEVTIMCTARRLTVKSSDNEAMKKTLRESRLSPSASIVVKIGNGAPQRSSDTSSLKERAAARKQKSKTNTMQSTGIYAKDDNAKGELIDGGGGVWYEHDVTTDDEAEEEQEEGSASSADTEDESDSSE